MWDINTSKTFDLSSSDYVGQSVIGSTGRIVFKYTSGTNYRGDIQIVVVTWNGAYGCLCWFRLSKLGA